MTNPIATLTLIVVLALCGFVNSGLWAWGAVCGVIGQCVLSYVLEQLKDPEDEKTRFDLDRE